MHARLRSFLPLACRRRELGNSIVASQRLCPQVNPDEASRQRLAALKAQQQQQQPAGGRRPAGGAAAAQPEVQAAAAAAVAQPPAAAGRAAGEAAEDDGTAEGDDAAGVSDPYAGMSARERKLHELRGKLQQCRKANQNAVIAEKRRERLPPPGDDSSQTAQLKWCVAVLLPGSSAKHEVQLTVMTVAPGMNRRINLLLHGLSAPHRYGGAQEADIR